MGLFMKGLTGKVSSGWHNMAHFIFQALPQCQWPWLLYWIDLVYTLVFSRVDNQASHATELTNSSGGDNVKKGKWQQCWAFCLMIKKQRVPSFGWCLWACENEYWGPLLYSQGTGSRIKLPLSTQQHEANQRSYWSPAHRAWSLQ